MALKKKHETGEEGTNDLAKELSSGNNDEP